MKNFLLITAIISLFSCSQKPQKQQVEYPKLDDPLTQFYDSSLKPFYHGVASGDPLSDAIIIWTKVTPEDSVPSLEVSWEMASDKTFSNIVKSGKITTNPDKDYTVKIDVTGLEAGATYFYRFAYEGVNSLVGQTKTAVSGAADSLKFAVVSCSNYEQGYFNAYGRIAEREDIDVVLHLGDYIYEYGVGGYGDSTTQRFHEPAHEIISLTDYRTRYAQYRLDKDLRAIHQNFPFITIWDDHEIANNSYKTGAQNHTEGEEGSYNDRKAIARKVYYEWLPMRESNQLYRSIDYGNLAKLIVLDERLAGRTAPVDSVTDPQINNEDRYMLGKSQLEWFKGELSNTDAKWKIIGNQVIFSYLNWGWPTFQINLDSWDGYPAERKKIIEHIQSEELENIIFVTGDTHSSWALEVTDDPFETYKTEGAVAVEFGTTSINSANANERVDDEIVANHEKKIVGTPLNPQLKYTNLRQHGYLELTLFPDKTRARWYYVSTNKKPDNQISLGQEKFVPLGENKIVDSL